MIASRTLSRVFFLGVLAAGTVSTSACAAKSEAPPVERATDEAEALRFPRAGCLVGHLTDARALNTTRRPLYAAHTGGVSWFVSTTLIATETAALLPALILDLRARELERAGVSVLCEDLVPMSGAPPFQDRGERTPLSLFDPSADARAHAAVDAAIATGSFDEVARAADEGLRALAEAPMYHCMTRHLLESVRRAALLAPAQAHRAEGAGLAGCSARLSWDFIELQASSLGTGEYLDIASAPMQADGVAIICRDVPPIPAP